jgi:hypothetical protein
MLLVLVALVHVLSTAYRLLVLRLPPHILLLTNDLRDLLHGVRHRLGRADESPAMGRFTYQEKLLYWAVVWSVLILIVSGLMMWNPIATTRFLTGQLIPAAKRAHASEALLLLMVGVGWHVWHVLKQRNWSIFTGLLSETEMIRSHPLEWDAIMEGRDRLPLDLGAVRLRRRRFVPLASLLTLALAGCLVVFVGFEQTVVITHDERQPISTSSNPGSSALLADDPASPAEMSVPEWSVDIRPLLVEECGECHNSDSDLDLTDYEAILAGDGLVIPGDPGQSALVIAQSSGDHPGQLSGDDLTMVMVWVMNGASR